MDFIAPVYRAVNAQEAEQVGACVQNMDFGFQAIYADGRGLRPLNLNNYRYNSIPNCYQLMDLEAMDEAGISVVQSYPTLNLMGSGIMVGILDTGECVIILPS